MCKAISPHYCALAECSAQAVGCVHLRYFTHDLKGTVGTHLRIGVPVAVSSILGGTLRRVTSPRRPTLIDHHVVRCWFSRMPNPVDGSARDKLGEGREICRDAYILRYRLNSRLVSDAVSRLLVNEDLVKSASG